MKNNTALMSFIILSFAFLALIKVELKISNEYINIKQNPQEYMRQVFVTTFTEEGFLKDELFATYWAYLPEAQLSTLIVPHLTVHRSDGTIWHIDAKKGQVKQPSLGTIEQIALYENVVLERPATPLAISLKLETHELRYQPKKQYAESDDFITVTKPDLKITGTGLRAFLEQGSVELLRDVKTYYTVTR